MNILFVEADEEGERSTSNWLCAIPAAAINRAGRGRHQAQLIHRKQFVRGEFDMAWPDLVVVERILLGPVIDRIQECQANGKKVLARFDDAYHLMPHYISSAWYWRRSILVGQKDGQAIGFKLQESMLKQFREGLGICDAASTPSRLLCEDYGRYAKKMFFIGNYPDLGNPAWIAPKPQHEGIIIGWGGGGTHKQSIRDSYILPALQRVCREFPHVKVMICGNEPYAKERLAQMLPEGRLIIQDWVSTEEWPYTVAKFDIGLAPLAGSYDDRRSWVKVLDYAILGIPAVASDRPPYATCQGVIRVSNKAKNWYRAIRTLLTKPSTYDRLSKMGKSHAWRYGIQSHVSDYLNVFTEILKG